MCKNWREEEREEKGERESAGGLPELTDSERVSTAAERTSSEGQGKPCLSRESDQG